MMKILYVTDATTISPQILSVLHTRLSAETIGLATLQEMIDILELKQERPNLILCEYDLQGVSLARSLLELSDGIPIIIITNNPGISLKLVSDADNISLTVVKKEGDILESLIKGIASLSPPKDQSASHDKTEEEPKTKEEPKIEAEAETGTEAETTAEVAEGKDDQDYIRVNREILSISWSFKADVYFRTESGQFNKIYEAGDRFYIQDLLRYLAKRKSQFFYVHKSQADAVLTEVRQNLDSVDTQADQSDGTARKVIGDTLAVIHDAVLKVGFTPEIQNLAKRSVSISIALLDKQNKLSAISQRLKAQGDKYIGAHSLMLGEIACALAYRVGWGSGSTLFKLSLAAFLHDMPLKSNELARHSDLQEVRRNPRYTPEEVRAFQIHPIKAAEFARMFHEIPPNVDTIVLQHHELPDGSGFPRGLSFNQISPLACILIIAHKLLDYWLKDNSDDSYKRFLEENKKFFDVGNFKQIFRKLYNQEQ